MIFLKQLTVSYIEKAWCECHRSFCLYNKHLAAMNALLVMPKESIECCRYSLFALRDIGIHYLLPLTEL